MESDRNGSDNPAPQAPGWLVLVLPPSQGPLLTEGETDPSRHIAAQVGAVATTRAVLDLRTHGSGDVTENALALAHVETGHGTAAGIAVGSVAARGTVEQDVGRSAQDGTKLDAAAVETLEEGSLEYHAHTPDAVVVARADAGRGTEDPITVLAEHDVQRELAEELVGHVGATEHRWGEVALNAEVDREATPLEIRDVRLDFFHVLLEHFDTLHEQGDGSSDRRDLFLEGTDGVVDLREHPLLTRQIFGILQEIRQRRPVHAFEQEEELTQLVEVLRADGVRNTPYSRLPLVRGDVGSIDRNASTRCPDFWTGRTHAPKILEALLTRLAGSSNGANPGADRRLFRTFQVSRRHIAVELPLPNRFSCNEGDVEAGDGDGIVDLDRCYGQPITRTFLLTKLLIRLRWLGSCRVGRRCRSWRGGRRRCRCRCRCRSGLWSRRCCGDGRAEGEQDGEQEVTGMQVTDRGHGFLRAT